MFDERARRFRGARRPGRCPDDLRRLAVGYAYDRAAEGAELAEVARELGTSPTSLRVWMGDAEADFRRVELVDPRAPWAGDGRGATLSVVTPGGYRLEGLDLAAAARLLPLLG